MIEFFRNLLSDRQSDFLEVTDDHETMTLLIGVNKHLTTQALHPLGAKVPPPFPNEAEFPDEAEFPNEAEFPDEGILDQDLYDISPQEPPMAVISSSVHTTTHNNRKRIREQEKKRTRASKKQARQARRTSRRPSYKSSTIVDSDEADDDVTDNVAASSATPIDQERLKLMVEVQEWLQIHLQHPELKHIGEKLTRNKKKV